MNALKFQKTVLEARMKHPDAELGCWSREKDGSILLILRPAVGMILKPDELMLDTNKLRDVTGYKGFKTALRAWVPDNQLKPTEDYRFTSGNKKIRIYQARDWRTGIDQSLLQYFDLNTVKLYQMRDKECILVTEKSGTAEVAVGIVLPVRL